MVIKKTASETDTDAILNPTLSGGQFTLTNASTGSYSVTIPGGSTNALDNKKKTVFVEIRATDATGTQYIVSRGKLKILPIPKPPKPFAPSQIPGLKCWVRGDGLLFQDAPFTIGARLDGDPIGGWKGTGAASHSFTQTTTGNRANLHLAALANLNTVTGNGTTTSLGGPALSAFIAADAFDLFLVAKCSTGGSGGTMTNWPAFAQDPNANLGLFIGASSIGLHLVDSGGAKEVQTSYTPGNWALIEARHLNNGIGLTVDGGTEAGTSAGNMTTLTGHISLFNTAGGVHPLAGDIAELVIYNRGLTDPERAKVLSYLHARWGVPAFSGAPA